MITDAEITELEALEREAWPAPWVARTFEIDCPCPNGNHCGNTHTCEEVEAPEAYPFSPEEPAEEGDGQCVVQIDVPGLESLAGPSARFIAAARNALPKLLAELKRTRTLVAERDAALRGSLADVDPEPLDLDTIQPPPEQSLLPWERDAITMRTLLSRAAADRDAALARAEEAEKENAKLRDRLYVVEKSATARAERAEKTAKAWADKIPEVTRLAHDRALAAESQLASLRAKVEALADGIIEGAHVGLDAMKLRLRATLAPAGEGKRTSS